MHNLDLVKAKIFASRDDIKFLLGYLRFHDKRIVFTNGCFDILHQGHIDYLAKAADHGDVLIIGLNTDESVKRIKGGGRPVQDETSRALLLASLRFVEAVVLFNEDTPYELIKTIQPDTLIKGSDYKPEDIVGYDIVTQKGGNVVTINYLEGYSTSGIINKINGME